jgi:hypothetical protein
LRTQAASDTLYQLDTLQVIGNTSPDLTSEMSERIVTVEGGDAIDRMFHDAPPGTEILTDEDTRCN